MTDKKKPNDEYVTAEPNVTVENEVDFSKALPKEFIQALNELVESSKVQNELTNKQQKTDQQESDKNKKQVGAIAGMTSGVKDASKDVKEYMVSETFTTKEDQVLYGTLEKSAAATTKAMTAGFGMLYRLVKRQPKSTEKETTESKFQQVETNELTADKLIVSEQKESKSMFSRVKDSETVRERSKSMRGITKMLDKIKKALLAKTVFGGVLKVGAALLVGALSALSGVIGTLIGSIGDLLKFAGALGGGVSLKDKFRKHGNRGAQRPTASKQPRTKTQPRTPTASTQSSTRTQPSTTQTISSSKPNAAPSPKSIPTKISDKLSYKTVLRGAGKVGGRFIPGIGYMLLAKDVYDVMTYAYDRFIGQDKSNTEKAEFFSDTNSSMSSQVSQAQSAYEAAELVRVEREQIKRDAAMEQRMTAAYQAMYVNNSKTTNVFPQGFGFSGDTDMMNYGASPAR
ncbi:hypothetical protein ACWM6O_000951 [Vibrio vulnificus]